ncbi:MAG: hypothetical protein H3C32_13005 [Anaerolineae bacterium]|nr:MAG: hypothetical protein UZ13_00324 [Chloroflexi bacterium OLB13]MBW7880217.1 hypothetical protein [Anaerolineae bacterium]
MQARYTGQVTAAEWRWVTTGATILALFILLPMILLPVRLTDPSRAFMGALHAPDGAAQVLSIVRIGQDNGWLWRALHTGEAQSGIFADPLYIVVGQLARITGLDGITLFHIARALAALFMFHALYVLGAAIWTRLTIRRVFWSIASVGAGFGWLIPSGAADTVGSGLYPFQAALLNVHLPLAIACLAFLSAAILDALAPDNTTKPSVINSGLTLIVFSIVLALIYPQALGPVTVTFGALLAVDGVRRSRLRRNALWYLWMVTPALPILAYNLILTTSYPLISMLWELRGRDTVPAVGPLLIGIGLPGLIALPGMWRGLRRFEPDGSAYMLVWLAAMVVMAFTLPFVYGGFLTGLMIPVAYFAARATEDVWFPRLQNRRWRYRVVAVILPLIAASHAAVMLAPLELAQRRVTLPADYLRAFQLVRGTGRQVVLAAPQVSVWLPVWAGQQVVSAGPALTLNAGRKAEAVAAFFTADDPGDCQPVLRGAGSAAGRYQVGIVLVGPYERAIGQSTVCLDPLAFLAKYGDVEVYRVPATP